MSAGLTGFTVLSPGASFHTARPVLTLDRFAISGDLSVKASGVHRSGDARIASDHLPVWAEVAVGPPVA